MGSRPSRENEIHLSSTATKQSCTMEHPPQLLKQHLISKGWTEALLCLAQQMRQNESLLMKAEVAKRCPPVLREA
eukprot:1139450-Pelagomonas_calceolata.AAC.2